MEGVKANWGQVFEIGHDFGWIRSFLKNLRLRNQFLEEKVNGSLNHWLIRKFVSFDYNFFINFTNI